MSRAELGELSWRPPGPPDSPVPGFSSLLFSQAADISKWKSRAIKLKAKVKPEMDKLGSPRTPSERGHCSAPSPPRRFLLTPQKALGSPKRPSLESPKSRFFDAGGTSEVLSAAVPKQFFDNSQLGTSQGEWVPPPPPSPLRF